MTHERRYIDRTSLVGGLVLIALGVLFLLDRVDVVNIRFAALGPLLAAAAGVILITAGADDRHRG